MLLSAGFRRPGLLLQHLLESLAAKLHLKLALIVQIEIA
jgi:hypothetical protein